MRGYAYFTGYIALIEAHFKQSFFNFIIVDFVVTDVQMNGFHDRECFFGAVGAMMTSVKL